MHLHQTDAYIVGTWERVNPWECSFMRCFCQGNILSAAVLQVTFTIGHQMSKNIEMYT